jgi:hypothetical protein
LSSTSEWFEKLKAKENPFEIYGLTGNPFPAQPVASPSGYDFNEKIRVRELEEIRDKFLAPSMQGEPTNLWVIGPLGVGKSSLMLHVQHIINTKFGDNCMALYIYSPIAGVASIYKDFIDNLISIGLQNVVVRLAQKVIKVKPSLVEQKKVQRGQGSIYLTFESLRNAVTQGILDLDGVITETKKNLFEKFPYIDSRIAELVMEYLRAPEDSIEALRNVKSADKLNYLIGLVHLIRLAGFGMIYLFIDQLEMGWGKWTRTQKDRFAIDVRELVVRTKPLLSVEITCNEDIISDLEYNFPQLLRPLPKKPHTQVYVGVFNLPSVKKLVEWYLDKKRIDKNFGELAPFEEEAIKEIYERTARNTYEILVVCHGLLNIAAQRKEKLITKKFVIENLKEALGALPAY